MIYRENSGRFRRRRLRRRRKLKNASYLARLEEQSAETKGSLTPAPAAAPTAIAWPNDLRAHLAAMDREEIKAQLERLSVDFDGRLGTLKLRSLLLQTITAKRRPTDGNGG